MSGVQRILLPYAGVPPLHANQRYTEPQRRRIVAEVRRDAGYLAKHHRLGKGHDRIRVWLEWRPKTVRRRDGGENLAPLAKAVIDGLVDAGVVFDDTPDRVKREDHVLLEPDRASAGLWLVVDLGNGR